MKLVKTAPSIASAAASVLALAFVLAACADHVAPSDVCADKPDTAGCKKAAASPATTYAQPTTPAVTPPTPPVAADAGADAAADAAHDAAPPTKPTVPPVSTACLDLTRCCSQVKDPLERAACVAVSVKQDAGICANAVIAYQVFGGCGHSPVSLPDIFNSDKTPNSSKDCTYLERACVNDPSQCDAAYKCDGASTAGTDTSTTDSCSSAPDPYCCRYPNDFDCSGSPPSPTSADPCDSAPDPYCCRYPNDFDCSGSSSTSSGADAGAPTMDTPDADVPDVDTTSADPCASAADPFCCRNPDDAACLAP